jgi:uncharacterized membrane protein YkvA (DUF1232 family)
VPCDGLYLDRAAAVPIYFRMNTRTPFFILAGRSAFGRILAFREEAGLLWRAFWHPETPLYLKGATLFAALYLVSPIDLVPDFIPFAGWIDDLILVPLMVSWIVRMLPPHVTAKPVDATVRRRY